MNTNEIAWIRGRFICGDGHPLPLNCTHPDTLKVVDEVDAVLMKMMGKTIAHRVLPGPELPPIPRIVHVPKIQPDGAWSRWNWPFNR